MGRKVDALAERLVRCHLHARRGRSALAQRAAPPEVGLIEPHWNLPCGDQGAMMENMKPEKSGRTGAARAIPRPAKGGVEAPATKAKPRAPAAPGRVHPEEWRGARRNAAINDTIVAKFKVLSARGKNITQIADKLGISIGRARNISAEIRLGKK